MILHRRILNALGLPLGRLAVVVWLAGPSSLHAQQTVPTGDTIRLRRSDLPEFVRRHNPALRSARFETALAAGDVTTARLRQNPQLEVMADVLPLGGGETSPNSRQYGIQLAFPIERGNKRALRTDVASRTRLLTEQRATDVFQQQLGDVDMAWTDLLASLAAERIAAATLEGYQRLVEVSRVRLEGRQISAAEFARIAVERGRAAVALEDQRIETTESRALVARLLGISGLLVPVDTLTPMLPPTLTADSLVTLALMQRADVRVARQNIEVALADQRLQEAMARPDLSLAFEYSMQQRIPLYGATVNMPLPRYNRNQGEREKAAVRLAQARDELERIEREVRGDLRRVLAVVESRLAALSRFGDGEDGMLQRSLAARTAAEFAYRNGATSLVELLDAERSYDEVRRAHTDAIAALNKSLIHLQFIAGLSPVPPS